MRHGNELWVVALVQRWRLLLLSKVGGFKVVYNRPVNVFRYINLYVNSSA